AAVVGRAGEAGAAGAGRRAGRRIGYFARLAPEKGLHQLVEAFIRLKEQPEFADCELWIAGWLGAHRRDYAAEQWQRLQAAGLEGQFQYFGELSRSQKVTFLRELDIFSVPTTYQEPKGLFVLEALAAGVPVVLPRHGAFPELLESVGGGCLFEPGDVASLTEQLTELLRDRARREQLAASGQQAVVDRRSVAVTSRELLQLIQEVIPNREVGLVG
ncbi:MAG: glycosyltransferase family 4 protein, partial [Planctomycetota bacterium]